MQARAMAAVVTILLTLAGATPALARVGALTTQDYIGIHVVKPGKAWRFKTRQTNPVAPAAPVTHR